MSVTFMKVKFQDVSTQIEYANSDYQPIPKKNKKYSYFDDGKIRSSRHSYMKILDVIPFKEASYEMNKFWEGMKKETPWIFAKETDYFIIGYELPDKGEHMWQTIYTTLFVRDIDGGWYGFRTESPSTDYTGRLVTNPHFDYKEFVEAFKK